MDNSNQTVCKGNNIRSVQSFRGIGALLVFISHCNLLLREDGSNRFSNWGPLGVSLFLMLSGFLAMHNYIGGVELRLLLRRRFRKIYPLHIITLLISIPLVYKTLSSNDILVVFSNILLIHSWIPESRYYFSFNAVSWYLSVFLFLTVITPGILKLYHKRKDCYSSIRIGAYIGIEFLWSIFASFGSRSHWLIYIFPLARAVDFLIGIEIALFLKRKNSLKWNANTALVIVGVLMAVSVFSTSFFFLVFV